MSLMIERTLAKIAIRQLTGNRKVWWVALLALLPALIAFIAARQTEQSMETVMVETSTLIVSVLLPLLALVVGTGVFGAEIDDGTIAYVLGKPVARWRIVLTRIVVAGAATAALLVPATLLAALVGFQRLDPDGLVLGFAAAVAVGGLLYCALFVALSLTTRRALIVGLIYVVVWEGSLSRLMPGTRALSIREYTLSLAEALAGGKDGMIAASLDGRTALIMGTVVAVLATAHAIRRLKRFEIGEAV
ncbi:MAG TPA: ABC transporter permease subunit [Longimicrobium sp.]|jgi:ABC-2 type transport system permease protein|uniref:ABC transporter permease subunit n=1 Tax=Longimicrobium sp. TaxID=2029185 RepID=UPI002EDAB3A7